MIYYSSPYSLEKDLGAAYNNSMQLLLSPDDWMVFTDGDVLFLTSDYGSHIAEMIERHPEVGLFTCYTNRVGALQQCLNGVINDDPNLLNLKRIALQQQKEKRYNVIELNNVISGFLMIIKKSTWDLIHGAPEGRGLLSIDNHISQRILNAGLKIVLLEGLYVCHFYRMDTGIHDRSHLILDSQSPIQQPRRKRSRFI